MIWMLEDTRLIQLSNDVFVIWPIFYTILNYKLKKGLDDIKRAL